jgi:L-fucose mutarotase
MLKNIPTNISPDLMHALMSMGHGDELVIADGSKFFNNHLNFVGNFPAASHAQRLVRASGINALPLLESILQFFPIDPYVEDHAVVMKLEPNDVPKIGEPTAWKYYDILLQKYEGNWVKLTQLDRQKVMFCF